MRPDDHANVDAERWTEAVQLRNAMNDGTQRARSERDANKAAEKM